MSNKYLDINGLSRFWEAIKTYVGGKIKQANWTQTNSNADDYIKNKPAISTSEGDYSIKESGASVARGDYSHVEGFRTSTDTTADYSHVEGFDSYARGMYSHAEGYSTTVWGTASHSEGWGTRALGNYSHAQNINTIAANNYQTAIGKYNEEDTETDAALQKAFIIGNGASLSDRSNAYTIDWQGDSEQQGRATTRDMTQEELDDLLGDLPSGIPADYVKKSGDTMTGNLNFTVNDKLTGFRYDSINNDIGWDWANKDGALIGLRSSSHPSEPGKFLLIARNQNNSTDLSGTANGSLTWGGNKVLTQNVWTGYFNYTASTTYTGRGNITIPTNGLYKVRAAYNNSSVLTLGYSSTSATSAAQTTILMDSSVGATLEVVTHLAAGTYKFWTKCGSNSGNQQVIVTRLMEV